MHSCQYYSLLHCSELFPWVTALGALCWRSWARRWQGHNVCPRMEEQVTESGKDFHSGMVIKWVILLQLFNLKLLTCKIGRVIKPISWSCCESNISKDVKKERKILTIQILAHTCYYDIKVRPGNKALSLSNGHLRLHRFYSVRNWTWSKDSCNIQGLV